MRALFCRLLRAQPRELAALGWAFAYFFLLLAAYYLLRPVRDEMAVQAGAGRLQWLFSATFLAMLALVPAWGWLCARLPRGKLLPAVYGFFVLNLVFFRFHFESDPVAAGAAFFVWLSVFNLFAVSVFWSFMADLFDQAQAARLFAAIAAGGSCGAIAGPLLSTALATQIGPANMLLASALLLSFALLCILKLNRWSKTNPRNDDSAPEMPLGGSILEGARAAFTSPYLLAIAGWLLCYSVLSTSLYFLQVQIVGAEIADPRERTRLFATLDLVVNSLTLILQLLVTARLGALLGAGWMLALMPLVSLAGFAILGAIPTLAALIVFGVTRRVGEFAISKPVREALYTVVPREDRYKAKNFIDTVIYRGGDTASGWLVTGLRSLGLAASGIAFAALPIAAAWVALSFWLGRKQAQLRG